jgi:tetratricopeptide (TPR) repeat protein
MMKRRGETDNHIGMTYRYPGSRPFNDTELDRRLFFGREAETKYIFHSILVENLFVLFARSGMGKTSLLNAGLMEWLRQKEFLPMVIRFNNREISPLDSVYSGIEEAVKQRNEQVAPEDRIDREPGEKDTPWQYFKTAVFWTADDKRLIPVLILDQFEEFFTMHSPEPRKAFIEQLADLVRGRVPRALRKTFKSDPQFHFPYSETPPRVKVIISMREDFLGHLEELTHEIPNILQNRFRLLPLKCQQAREAIIRPARLSADEYIRAKGFSYADETVDEMLDFLSERRLGGKIVGTDEVEPFQLQLLCRYIEETVSKKVESEGAGGVVQKSDLGGKSGMRKVLQGFYERGMWALGSVWVQGKVRKLCEKGLIDNRSRLSLEEGYIRRKYNVSKAVLSQLVDGRLLRSEPRVGSVYYELSHDTLVEPILQSQQERKRKRNRFRIPVLVFVFVIIAAVLFNQISKNMQISALYEDAGRLKQVGKYGEAIKKYEQVLEIDESRVLPYREIGEMIEYTGEYARGIETYKKALSNRIKIDTDIIYYRLGRLYEADGEPEEAVTWYEKLKDMESASIGGHEPHIYIGDIYSKLKRGELAEREYLLALEKSEGTSVEAYKGLALLNVGRGRYHEAFDQFNSAVAVCPECAYIYREIAEEMQGFGLSGQSAELYAIASGVDIDDPGYYEELGDDCYRLKRFDLAIKNYEKAKKSGRLKSPTYGQLLRAYIYDEQFDRAIDVFIEILKESTEHVYIYKDLAGAMKRRRLDDKVEELHRRLSEVKFTDAGSYEKLGDALASIKENERAIESYNSAIELDALNESAYLKVGRVLEAEEKYDEAAQNYKTARRRNPTNPSTKIQLARIELIRGNFSKAFVLADELLGESALSPGDELSIRFIRIASSDFQVNRYETYAEDLEKIIEQLKSAQTSQYYYRSKYMRKSSRYEAVKKIVVGNNRLRTREKLFLLHLISIIGNPSGKKLIEFEKKYIEPGVTSSLK